MKVRMNTLKVSVVGEFLNGMANPKNSCRQENARKPNIIMPIPSMAMLNLSTRRRNLRSRANLRKLSVPDLLTPFCRLFDTEQGIIALISETIALNVDEIILYSKMLEDAGRRRSFTGKVETAFA